MSKHSLPTDCQGDKKIFLIILLKVASHHISTGCHKLYEELIPAEINGLKATSQTDLSMLLMRVEIRTHLFSSVEFHMALF